MYLTGRRLISTTSSMSSLKRSNANTIIQVSDIITSLNNHILIKQAETPHDLFLKTHSVFWLQLNHPPGTCIDDRIRQYAYTNHATSASPQ